MAGSEMAAAQAETQRKSDEAQQFEDLQDLLAHKSPKVRAVAQGQNSGELTRP